MTALSWNRRNPDKIRSAHRRFEKTAKRRRYLKGRGVIARKMSDRLRHEIKMGRFPKPERCVFKDVTCYGTVNHAHWDYESWDHCMPLCRSHASRFDHWKPKTLQLSSDGRKRARKAA